MRISSERCVACGNCISICPMSAISINPVTRRAEIDRDSCVECYQCFRGMSQEHLNPTLVRAIRQVFAWARIRFDPEPDVCPTAAFEPEQLTWPRTLRRAFSDVTATHESTGIHGRGTEEVKTNDVTGRVKPGEAGLVIELGRPAVGVRFRDIQRMTSQLARAGADFEQKNPITRLMTDRSTGLLKDDILDEKVLSAIVELKTPIGRLDPLLDVVDEVAPELDTVVSVGIGAVSEDDGTNPIPDIMRRRGYPVLRGKMNLGLGRSTNPTHAA